jgi:hypothetical protein
MPDDPPADDLDLGALPLDHLLASPLVAAARASVALAAAEAEFIEQVGFHQGVPRMVQFDFDRPVEQPGKDGTSEVVTEQVRVSLPLLSLVSVPNLRIDTLQTQFTLEIKEIRRDPDGQGVQVLGRPAAHREQTRDSDRTARYTVDLRASAEPPTEALARVLDLMAQTAVALVPPAKRG